MPFLSCSKAAKTQAEHREWKQGGHSRGPLIIETAGCVGLVLCVSPGEA